MSELRFILNGEDVCVSGVDPNTTLLDWLRSSGRTGTKEGCAEGECGACAVVVVRSGPDGSSRYEPINSCLLLLPAVAGCEIVTVEGVRRGGDLHPVQSLLAKGGGSQCGYCTPGFVMSLFAEYYRPGRDGYDPEAISGNLCRCTGYRPIRDAAMAMGAPEDEDAVKARLAKPPPALERLEYEADGRRFLRPESLEEAFNDLAAHPDARIIGGGTDLVVERNLWQRQCSVWVSLEAVGELKGISWTDEALEIGAGVSLSHIEEEVGERVALLGQLFPLFSSRLIRNRATLGGNLVNASPVGDGPPALLALDAEVVLRSVSGSRTVPLHAFFLGYRKTALEQGEILTRVRIPRPFPTVSRFYKVSKRILDDISTVAAGFALTLDAEGRVEKARFAYGGVAATPLRARAAEDALVGKAWSQQSVEELRPHLEGAFTPLSDHRGSAEYRARMVPMLLEKFFHETGEEGA